MASVVDICNLALAHLGDEASVASISPPDGSVQAEHCARFYAIARDGALEAHDWAFARARTTPAELTTDRDGWAYKYSMPAACIIVRRAMPEGAADDHDGVDFIVEGSFVYSNEPVHELVFTQRITDTTKFSPLFVICFSWLLASFLAGPVRKESNGESATRCYKMFSVNLSSASGSDSNQQHTKPIHKPAWIANR